MTGRNSINNLYQLLMRCQLFFLTFIISMNVLAQPRKSVVDSALASIAAFQKAESKRDSLRGEPIGSKKETDIRTAFLFYDSIYQALDKMDTAGLSFDNKVNIELLKYSIKDDIVSYRYKGYLNPILSDEGFHTQLVRYGSQVLTSKKDYEEYLLTLRDIPRFINENLTLMRLGLKEGISQPRIILNGYENTYQQHIVDDPEKSVFWKPFLQKPVAINEEDWEKIKQSARLAIRESVVRGFRDIKTFFDKEYLPGARTTIGTSNFPNGLAYYRELVKIYTTTPVSYEEVYQVGLKEVERINTEMREVLKKVNFKGTLAEFINMLRTDPKFYATSAEQLLKEASFIAKKADGLLPRYFGKLPRQPYGVEPVPAHLAPTYTAGRYSGAPISSRRSANYWVNTYALPSRPLYALESLTLHEAVPGHHLQIALTQELDSLPQFRRNLYVNAFGEGWGLYAEWLGNEMGFYKDPYSYFGRLTYDMWRACRLVIDVGLHAKGWTREEAVDYLSKNTALSLHEVNTEINRYISWPGQALAYKMGELKIKELRKKAEDKLGEKFDIREFHDLILSQGTVTMEILEWMVEGFIAGKLKIEGRKAN